MAKPPAGRQYKTWSRGRANRAGGLLSASAISVDALAVAGEQDDAGCEQADGAGVGSLEAAGKLVRIVVVEQGRSESIEALHEDLAAARAVARIEIHGASERLGFLERGGFEMTKRGNGLRARGRLIRLVAVDAPESGAERHRHLRSSGATAPWARTPSHRACQGRDGRYRLRWWIRAESGPAFCSSGRLIGLQVAQRRPEAGLRDT